jgi:PBP1b-binding outer membrane lipoprotein LpoB
MIRTKILVSLASTVFLLAGCSTSDDPCVAYRNAIQRWGARSEANAYAALTMIEDMQHGVSTQEAVTTYQGTLRDEHATWPEIQILSKAKYDAMDKCPGAESP